MPERDQRRSILTSFSSACSFRRVGIFLTQGSNPGLPRCRRPGQPPRKSKNTGVGGLSLLQRIFLTQELNRGLLHCRPILYQLSYKGNFPASTIPCLNPAGNRLLRSPAHRAHSRHFLCHREEQKQGRTGCRDREQPTQLETQLQRQFLEGLC